MSKERKWRWCSLQLKIVLAHIMYEVVMIMFGSLIFRGLCQY